MEKFIKFYSELFKDELEYDKYSLEFDDDTTEFKVVNSDWGLVFHTKQKSEFVKWLYALRIGQFSQYKTLVKKKLDENRGYEDWKRAQGSKKSPRSGRMVGLETRKFYQAMRIK